jgi:hypothetical protein
MSSLSTKFEQFRQRIELTENERNNIIRSHLHLRERVLQKLDYVEKSFLTGSYKKSTLLRPANDVDIFIVINHKENEITPQAILNKLKKDLNSSYPNSQIRQDKPCITIKFNHITIELTPAIEIESYWQTDNSFYIPNLGKDNSWQKVDNPRILEKKLSQKNGELNGMLTPLIKMMKKAKINNNIKMQSFEMEKLAINSFYWGIESYRYGVQELLKVYDWKQQYSFYKIESFSDDDFAFFCRNELFGSDFPKD